MAGLRMPGLGREYVAVTGNTTLTNFDVGKTFSNLGAAGSVTITLPDPTTCQPGDDIRILACADQTLAFTSTSKLITFNNAAASTCTLSTSGEKIGGGFTVTCTGAKWHVLMHLEETQTVTVS